MLSSLEPFLSLFKALSLLNLGKQTSIVRNKIRHTTHSRFTYFSTQPQIFRIPGSLDIPRIDCFHLASGLWCLHHQIHNLINSSPSTPTNQVSDSRPPSTPPNLPINPYRKKIKKITHLKRVPVVLRLVDVDRRSPADDRAASDGAAAPSGRPVRRNLQHRPVKLISRNPIKASLLRRRGNLGGVKSSSRRNQCDSFNPKSAIIRGASSWIFALNKKAIAALATHAR